MDIPWHHIQRSRSVRLFPRGKRASPWRQPGAVTEAQSVPIGSSGWFMRSPRSVLARSA